VKNNKLSKAGNIHFVGVGGIGMSGLARVMLEMGHKVSGSDLETNSLTKKLESIGAKIFEGHKSENILSGTRLLVYSSSVSKDNPELLEAKKKKIRISHRSEMLAEVFNTRKGIAVTGTHGKTTTTSLVSVMLEKNGMDPTVVIGGEVDDFKGNSKLGKGLYAVAEADESDSSFLNLKPLYAIVTNIEMEHMDHFKDMDDIMRSYRAFINNVKRPGMVFYNNEDENCRAAVAGYKGRAMSFGFLNTADIYPLDIRMDCFKTSFRCVYKNRMLGTVELSIPGNHNILNALAAILAGLHAGLEFSGIAKSLKGFSGAKRRFQLKAEADGVMLIDDYAHHPTEIRAVLDACRNWNAKRLVAIFQPHRYSRTKFLASAFGRAFKGVDLLILTDIFAASEKPIKGVSSKNILDEAKSNGISGVMILKKEKIASYIDRIKKSGDMIVVMGAGDIKKVADQISLMMEGQTPQKTQTLTELKGLIKGRVLSNQNLKSHTSFKIGGPADIWADPADYNDLRKLLAFTRKEKINIFVIGNGTNVLASDEGFKGLVIRLGSKYFRQVSIKGRNVTVGAGFSLPGLVSLCCSRGLRGLESLVGIPGTVGGAVYMNAGGWASPMYKNIGDFVVSVKVMDRKGHVKILKKDKLKFEYRHSNIGDCIILEVILKLEKAVKRDLLSSCARFLKMKRQKQALDVPSAGCVFKNPQDSQFTCGQMIDMLGLKGKRIGMAEVSTKHANFLINRGGATCRDVKNLAEFIRGKVKDNYNVDLDLEIKVI